MPAVGYAGGGPSKPTDRTTMTIHFPYHAPGNWRPTPLWMFFIGRGPRRRRNWRWIVDHNGCECVPYWEYR
jgi:hypothetical protein